MFSLGPTRHHLSGIKTSNLSLWREWIFLHRRNAYHTAPNLSKRRRSISAPFGGHWNLVAHFLLQCHSYQTDVSPGVSPDLMVSRNVVSAPGISKRSRMVFHMFSCDKHYYWVCFIMYKMYFPFLKALGCWLTSYFLRSLLVCWCVVLRLITMVVYGNDYYRPLPMYSI